ncbi:MAG TPA: hypothetical protein VGA05_08455 [Candidatus Bathyarchaeia archaeon]
MTILWAIGDHYGSGEVHELSYVGFGVGTIGGASIVVEISTLGSYHFKGKRELEYAELQSLVKTLRARLKHFYYGEWRRKKEIIWC